MSGHEKHYCCLIVTQSHWNIQEPRVWQVDVYELITVPHKGVDALWHDFKQLAIQRIIRSWPRIGRVRKCAYRMEIDKVSFAGVLMSHCIYSVTILTGRLRYVHLTKNTTFSITDTCIHYWVASTTFIHVWIQRKFLQYSTFIWHVDGKVLSLIVRCVVIG